jgi:hypothetical protein
MAVSELYVYRGTTSGWPGNPGPQELHLTPTSRDPLVATLFALNCVRFGKAIVQLCDRGLVADLIQSGNTLNELEREVVVGVAPAEFTDRFVVDEMPVSLARQILAELGFELPVGIGNNDILNWWLGNTPRLSHHDIARFNKAAGRA